MWKYLNTMKNWVKRTNKKNKNEYVKFWLKNHLKRRNDGTSLERFCMDQICHRTYWFLLNLSSSYGIYSMYLYLTIDPFPISIFNSVLPLTWWYLSTPVLIIPPPIYFLRKYCACQTICHLIMCILLIYILESSPRFSLDM